MANFGTSEMKATLAVLNRALKCCVVIYFWKVMDRFFFKSDLGTARNP